MIKVEKSVSYLRKGSFRAIVFREKIPGLGNLVIRYPNKDDAQLMCDYINILSHEGTFVTFQGEEMTLESEKEFLESLLKKIEEKKNVMLLAFIDAKLIGISGIQSKDKVASHEGVLGISIAKEYRGNGIGKKLFSSILEEAKEIETLRIITLQVFANNSIAKKLYESFGFREYGRLPGGIFYKGTYIDDVYMFKTLTTD